MEADAEGTCVLCEKKKEKGHFTSLGLLFVCSHDTETPS